VGDRTAGWAYVTDFYDHGVTAASGFFFVASSNERKGSSSDQSEFDFHLHDSP